MFFEKLNEVCGEELESYMPALRKPIIIVFDVPEDITTENVVQTIALHNSELNLDENEIKTKFVFEDKKNPKNLLLVVNSETRKRLVDRKVKISCHVCNSSDYLRVTCCYKCSKYNQRVQECLGLWYVTVVTT
jgi:hypothetical protein